MSTKNFYSSCVGKSLGLFSIIDLWALMRPLGSIVEKGKFFRIDLSGTPCSILDHKIGQKRKNQKFSWCLTKFQFFYNVYYLLVVKDIFVLRERQNFTVVLNIRSLCFISNGSAWMRILKVFKIACMTKSDTDSTKINRPGHNIRRPSFIRVGFRELYLIRLR